MKPSDYLNAEQLEAIGGPKAPPLSPLMVIDAQAAALVDLRARVAALERVEKAALRVALAWPYYRELTDYVEFESACNGLRAVLGLTSAAEGGPPNADR